MNNLDTLANEILKGNVVLFVGGGLSRGAGVPSWQELVKKMASEIGCRLPTGERISSDLLLKIPQYYLNECGRLRLEKRVIDVIEPRSRELTDNHRLLAQLPIQTWITTNWDNLLETALKENRKKVKVFVCDKNISHQSADEVCLFKIHGDCSNPETIVITEEDYYSYSHKNPLIRIKLGSLLIDKTFLFIGYGLRDPDFNQIRAEISYYLQGHKPIAYMIDVGTDFDLFEKKYLENAGIHVIRSETSRTSDPKLILENILNPLVAKVLQPPLYEVIPDRIQRTEQILKKDKELLGDPDRLRDSLYLIRMQTTLSSFAISEDEPQSNKKYHRLLIEERENFIELLNKGAFIKCIVSPSQINIDRPGSREYFKARLNQLLGFLRNDNYLEICEFVIFPESKPNQIIYSNELIFEGYKTQVESGFDLTVMRRDPVSLNFNTQAFDAVFDYMKKTLLQNYQGPEGPEMQRALRDIVYRKVEEALQKI